MPTSRKKRVNGKVVYIKKSEREASESGKAGSGASAGSVPKINNPAGIPDNAITEQEFLALRGVGDSVSGYGVDRIGGANMTRMSERQRTAAKTDIAKGINDYQQKRNEAKAEYKSLVDKGVLRDKTSIEKLITKAHGNPDNESTQAARRMAKKRGIDWRTGKNLLNK